MRAWIEQAPVEVPDALQGAVGGHPLVTQTLVRRGLADVESALAFLDSDRYRPASSLELPNLAQAAERLERAIAGRERICVWGDFDVDGQTATAVLISTLRALGADARYHIPNRDRESHGVYLPVLGKRIDEGVKLVLTCDTGITAHEAVTYARSRGVDVVITDHHDLPPALPEACAVVNPKMLPMDHPLRELPGSGCAYKLAEALFERAGRAGDAEQFHDLVALGIVADVATQSGDTRYLLQRGLAALRRTRRLGLQVMLEQAGLKPERLTEEHIAFELAPRMNALGRLADANPAVELLTTGDLLRARTLVVEMEGLNIQRKLACDQVFQAAQARVERDPSLLQGGALVLSDPEWPAGVIGIVAGRLAERYRLPVILLATPHGEPGRGSARSIEGCDITAAIRAHGDVLRGFGGHPMAAGLSIDPERIPEFRRALSRTILDTCSGIGEQPVLPIDGYLALSDLSLDLVEQIERLAPFGRGNPPLVLVSRALELQSGSPVGRSGEHRQVIVEDEAGAKQRVIWWRGAGEPLPEGRFDLAYALRASDFQGRRDLQVEWIDARPLEEAAPLLRPPGKRIEIVDLREEPRPRAALEQLRSQQGLQVWAEAEDKAAAAGRGRDELTAGEVLVVWTIPPGPAELREVLEKVAPLRLYLFAVDPGLDAPDRFLKRLAGLAKRALRTAGGRVSLSTLTASTAQREAAVRAGLAYWEARGDLAWVGERDGDQLCLAAGEGHAQPEMAEAQAHLVAALLEETAAYRAHFARADADSLVDQRYHILDQGANR